jgi:hypothetical protein
MKSSQCCSSKLMSGATEVLNHDFAVMAMPLYVLKELPT